MPSWGVAIVVLVSLLCAIILLHVLALMIMGPCLWSMWKKRSERAQKLAEEDTDADMTEMTEMTEMAEMSEMSTEEVGRVGERVGCHASSEQ